MELVLEKCKSLRLRINALESNLLTKVISEKEYENEMKLINAELEQLEREVGISE